MSSSVPWWAFSSAEPDLAEQVQDLFVQYGRAFGYLATIRADGGPRVHPVSPVFTDGRLLCFVLPSPKRRDLQRDGRYALHAYPGESSDDEAYLAGRAFVVADDTDRARLAHSHHADAGVDWQLFELTVSVAVFTRRLHAASPPDHHIWHAP